VRRLVERSRLTSTIVEELDRRAMPMEISAADDRTHSSPPRCRRPPPPASGSSSLHRAPLWPQADTWYDGRRDFTASTSAALDYLGKLYLDFGDWQLALARYNCGEAASRVPSEKCAAGPATDYAQPDAAERDPALSPSFWQSET
jgi:membrane-bound lytic murein transglycosylase D